MKKSPNKSMARIAYCWRWRFIAGAAARNAFAQSTADVIVAARRHKRTAADAAISVLKTSPPPTACPTIMSMRCWWMATASGPAPITAWVFTKSSKWKTYTTKDGLAHRAVLSLALDKRTGDVWAGTMGGLEPHLRGAHRYLHPAEFRPQQRCGLWRFSGRRERVGGHRRRRRPPESAHRPVVALQRAQHAHERDLGLRRFRHSRQGLLRRMGQRPAGV